MPPFDPDDWSDEQWMEWLRATTTSRPRERTGASMRRDSSSAGATVLGAAMMGLQKGMYGDIDKPEVTIEADADGQDDGIKVVLDPDDPSQSTIVVPPR